MKVLIVDDDRSLSHLIAGALRVHQRYTVEMAFDGEAGWALMEAESPDLLILDIRMPKLDGVQFCRQLRDCGHQIPVLMLTSRDTSQDKIVGLDAGADDYVVKPFDLGELLARVRAALRRNSPTAPPILRWGDLQFDPSKGEFSYRGKLIPVSPKEYSLLELFLRNTQQVFSRSVILDNLWTLEDSPDESAVKTLIKRLRQKLAKSGAPKNIIESVYGIGYRLNPLENC